MKRTSLLKNFVERGVVLFPIFVGIFRSRGKDPLNKKLSGSRRNSRKLGKRNDIIRSGSFPIAEEFLAKTGTFQYLLIPKLITLCPWKHFFVLTIYIREVASEVTSKRRTLQIK